MALFVFAGTLTHAPALNVKRLPRPLATPNDLGFAAADAFALYRKTKNFHWHMSGSHDREYHLLLDEHAA